PRPAPAPSSPPNLRTSIPPKRNVDVGQQPQRHPAGRCRSVCVGACWNRRRLARAREGREYDQRRQIPLIFPIRSAQRARESAPLSVLQNLAIVVDDPVPRCPRPAPAPSSPPNLRTSIPPKRNVDVGQQPQRHPAGRCRSVSVGACWNRRRLARAREGREYDQRRPLSVLQNLAIVVDDPVPRCPRPAPAPSSPPNLRT